MPRAENVCETCFARLAARATEKFATRGLHIYHTTQGDIALSWKCSAIHPLQALENIHQHRVRQEIWGKPESRRRAIEDSELKNYFLFDAGDPVLRGPLLGDAPDPGGDLLEARLRAATTAITQCERIAKATAALGDETGSPELLDPLREKLQQQAQELRAIRGQLVAPQGVSIPILDEVDGALAAVNENLALANTWRELHDACSDGLAVAARHLKRGLAGGARVAMLHMIEPFYLFRLMVRFRVESTQPISEDDRREVSGALTGMLNNGIEWITELNIANLRQMTTELERECRGRWFFHLKGGRSLSLLLGKDGTSDWDTQIVIDPELPPNEWYGAFNDVHDRVLHLLCAFKRTFFVKVHELGNATYGAGAPAAPNRAPFPVSTAPVKAELIDVSIPRRDTVEIYEQWQHTRSRLHCTDATRNIPIPGFGYHFDENLTMINEVLASVSQSADKCFKRIHRLHEVAGKRNTALFDEFLAEEEQQLQCSEMFPSTWSVIESLKDSHLPSYSVTVVLLRQCLDSYGLRHDPGLRKVVDDELLALSRQKVELPQALADSLATISDTAIYDPNNDGLMLQWIARMASLGERLERHLAARAAFFGFGPQSNDAQKLRRAQLGKLIKALYTNGVFSQDEELEVQFAVAGAFAAHLTAGYMRVEPVDKLEALESVAVLDVVLFAARSSEPEPQPANEEPEEGNNASRKRKREADTAQHSVKRVKRIGSEVAFAIARSAIMDYLSDRNVPDIHFTMLEEEDEHCIRLYWPTEIQLGDFTYSPLAVTIRAVDNIWPQLAFHWGFPTLSLPDLVREYERRAGSAEDWRCKQRLRKSGNILKELITRHHLGPAGQVPAPEPALPYVPAAPPAALPRATRGLKNLGATCYMNSVVKLLCCATELDGMRETQERVPICLFNEIIGAVRTDELTTELRPKAGPLFDALAAAGWGAQMVNDYGSNTHSTYCDAMHLLDFLIGACDLDQNLAALHVVTRTVADHNDAWSQPPPVLEPFLIPPLHEKACTVQQLIDNYSAPESVESHVFGEGQLLDSAKTTRYIVSEPQSLLFRPVRFKEQEIEEQAAPQSGAEVPRRRGVQTKITARFEIGSSIVVSWYQGDDASEQMVAQTPVRMTPWGVLVHHGTTLRGGHYTFYERRNDQWFHHDDERVNAVAAGAIEDTDTQSHVLVLFRKLPDSGESVD